MLKMEFTGNTPDELTAQIREYVKGLKGTRGGKSGDAEETGNAPLPMPPPNTQSFGQAGPAGGFALPAGGAGPQAGGPFAPAASTSPEVSGLVSRIVARIDAAVASGQPADSALTWFRQQCGPEAAQASMDQIKAHFLPKLAVPALAQIAQLMGA